MKEILKNLVCEGDLGLTWIRLDFTWYDAWGSLTEWLKRMFLFSFLKWGSPCPLWRSSVFGQCSCGLRYLVWTSRSRWRRIVSKWMWASVGWMSCWWHFPWMERKCFSVCAENVACLRLLRRCRIRQHVRFPGKTWNWISGFSLVRGVSFEMCMKWISLKRKKKIHEISLWGFSISLIENVKKLLILMLVDFPLCQKWSYWFEPLNIFIICMSKKRESRSPLECLTFWDSVPQTPNTQKQGDRDSGLGLHVPDLWEKNWVILESIFFP